MSYNKRNPTYDGYKSVSRTDDRSSGGSVELKAIQTPSLTLSLKQLSDNTAGEVSMDYNDEGSPNMSEAHGRDLQHVILCYFGVLGFVLLATLYGAMLGIVIGTNSTFQSDIKVSAAANSTQSISLCLVTKVFLCCHTNSHSLILLSVRIE